MHSVNLDPARTMAIGDSVWTSKPRSRPASPSRSGGFSRHELSEAGALMVFPHVREILVQLQATPLAQLAR